MLAHGEDEGVVDGKARALWLRYVQVMALGMRSWMESEEFVGRILARVIQGQRKGERVRVRLD